MAIDYARHVTAYLCLSDGLLDIIVSELVSDGVSNADAVAFEKKIVVHYRLDVAIETPRHFVVKFHGDDVHERARLVTKCVLRKDATDQLTMLNKHLHCMRDRVPCDCQVHVM